MFRTLLVLLLCAGATWGQSGEPSGTVTAIRFEGLHSLSPAALELRIETRKGERYDSEKVDRDVKRLTQILGLRDGSVVRTREIEPGKIEVTFVVSEARVVRKISFPGLSGDHQKAVRDAIHTQLGLPLNPVLIEVDRDQIIRALVRKGYHWTGCEVREEPMPGGTHLKFLVGRGPLTRLQDVTFNGARAFSKHRLLQEMPGTSIWTPFSNKPFVMKEFKRDVVALTLFYRGRGYLDATVRLEDVTWSDDLSSAQGFIHVEEGELYTVSSLKFERIERTDLTEAFRRTKVGVPYEPKGRLRDDIRNLERLLARRGLFHIHIKHRAITHIERPEVAVTLYAESRTPDIELDSLRFSNGPVYVDAVLARTLGFLQPETPAPSSGREALRDGGSADREFASRVPEYSEVFLAEDAPQALKADLRARKLSVILPNSASPTTPPERHPGRLGAVDPAAFVEVGGEDSEWGRAIRRALISHPEYLQWVRPGTSWDFVLDQVRSALMQAHLAQGFTQVDIGLDPQHDPERLRVVVKKGPEVTAASPSVEGNQAIATQDLIEAITTTLSSSLPLRNDDPAAVPAAPLRAHPETRRPLWPVGGEAPLDDATLLAIGERVRDEYINRGYRSARIAVTLPWRMGYAEPNVAPLITVLEEGPLFTIATIRLEHEPPLAHRERYQSTLAYLIGRPFTKEARKELEHAILSTGHFGSVRTGYTIDHELHCVHLGVAVSQVWPRTALGTEQLQAIVTMQAAADWARRSFGKSLSLRFEGERLAESSKEALGLKRLTFALDGERALWDVELSRPDFSASLLVERRALTLALHHERVLTRIDVDDDLVLRLFLILQPDMTTPKDLLGPRSHLILSHGVRTARSANDPAYEAVIELDPGMLHHLVKKSRDLRWELSPEALVVSGSESRRELGSELNCRIHRATGELTGWARSSSREHRAEIVLAPSVGREALDRFHERTAAYRVEPPDEFFLGRVIFPLLDRCLDDPLLEETMASPGTRALTRSFLRHASRQLADRLMDRPSNRQEVVASQRTPFLRVPLRRGEQRGPLLSGPAAARLGATLCSALEGDSWLAALIRDAVARTNGIKTEERSALSLLTGPGGARGPLCRWIVAEWFHMQKDQDNLDLIASQGLEVCNLAGLREDLHFLQTLPHIDRLLVFVGSAWQEAFLQGSAHPDHDALEDIFGALAPNSAPEDFLRAGVEWFWRQGPEAWVRQRLSSLERVGR